jgi:nucleoside 2-deoxyribosyltransferase
MPITTPADCVESYGEDVDHFNHVLEFLFEPAIKAAGLEPVRPAAQGTDLIHAEIVRNLETADLVLCDISSLNPNVFFELGIRTALDRPVCLVRDSATKIPFDTGLLNYYEYDHRLSSWTLQDEIKRLTKHLMVTTERSGGHNGLWQHFGLTQRGTEAIQASADAPEGAAMAILLEELRGLRVAVDDRTPARYASPSVDKATRARWRELIGGQAEPFGSEIATFVGKAQEVAANDGVRLDLVDVADNEIVTLETRNGELSPRARNLIASLASSYGIDVGFVHSSGSE